MMAVGAFYNEIDPHAAGWTRNLIAAGLISPGVVDTRDIRDVAADDVRHFRRAHWFSGIAGWELALAIAGWPWEWSCWTGSCPCQPYSSAGKGKGDADPRNLWPVWFPLIRECRPECVFGEQVDKAIGHGWLDGISADLEGEGYAVGSVVLGSHSVGSPNIRNRLYWVAHASKPECRRGAEPERQQRQLVHAPDRCGVGGMADPQRDRPDDQQGIGREQGGTGERWYQPLDGGDSGRLAHAQSSRGRANPGAIRGGQTPGLRGETGEDERRAGEQARGAGDSRPACGMGDPGRSGLARRSRQSRDDGTQRPPAQRAGGDAGPWSDFDLIPCRDGKSRRVESGTFPLVDGFPGRVGQLRGYGNAINPWVAAEFITAYMEAMR